MCESDYQGLKCGANICVLISLMGGEIALIRYIPRIVYQSHNSVLSLWDLLMPQVFLYMLIRYLTLNACAGVSLLQLEKWWAV